MSPEIKPVLVPSSRGTQQGANIENYSRRSAQESLKEMGPPKLQPGVIIPEASFPTEHDRTGGTGEALHMGGLIADTGAAMSDRAKRDIRPSPEFYGQDFYPNEMGMMVPSNTMSVAPGVVIPSLPALR